MIPKNLFFMWDKPRAEWPVLVKFCIGMWERLNPDWNVQVYDLPMARDAVKNDIALDIFDSLRPPAQSDILRTKLLSTYGGIWVDASCLPHMPISHWIDEFADADLSALPTGAPGRSIASWFLISKPSGLLLSRQYEIIARYWKTKKIFLPQDPHAITLMEENWRDYITDHAAHTLRIMPYFWWHNLFSRQLEIDPEFAACFKQQKYIATRGGYAVLLDSFSKNNGNNVPMHEDVRKYLETTDVKLSKLHHRLNIDYPFAELRAVILARGAAPAASGTSVTENSIG